MATGSDLVFVTKMLTLFNTVEVAVLY